MIPISHTILFYFYSIVYLCLLQETCTFAQHKRTRLSCRFSVNFLLAHTTGRLVQRLELWRGLRTEEAHIPILEAINDLKQTEAQ